ncbi:hypothetical protein WICPIJ_000850 [Wickerhamomyces pijperi]|uniref:Uncharacterized protein n=1 Tax=Wickerhamomyces pijperi TaxID=599730 RepID=A0A9P8QF79_WICPI|nr:hypothetical protein WICPIJ_000850 [Wickerhamomyces pijperi]
MAQIPANSRANYLSNDLEKSSTKPPPLSNTIDKLLLSLIFTLLIASTVILPALCLFGSVSKINLAFDVYRMYVKDTTTYHDIPDVYPISLWNYCYGFTDMSTSDWLCIPMKYGFYFNPYSVMQVQTNSLPTGEQIAFTNAQAINLDFTPFLTSVNYVAFILAHVGFVVGALFFLLSCYRGTRRLFKKGQHAYSLFKEGSTTSLVLASVFNAASAVMIIIMFKRFEDHFNDAEMISFEIGKTWQVCMWLTVLLNIILLVLIEIESNYRASLFIEFRTFNNNSRDSAPVFVPNALQTQPGPSQQPYYNYTVPSNISPPVNRNYRGGFN